jgi:hypothetical protein
MRKERSGAKPQGARQPHRTTVWRVPRSGWPPRGQPSWRAKGIEQRLPVIAARLGILWNEVTGSSRPMPSEIQLTSTGTEMTTEEDVATAETHLRYAEGHLQPSEEHLADAEVHLKLVKAHLAALVMMEPAEADPPEAAVLPLPDRQAVRRVQGEPR